jgi:hypothetical protein
MAGPSHHQEEEDGLGYLLFDTSCPIPPLPGIGGTFLFERKRGKEKGKVLTDDTIRG